MRTLIAPRAGIVDSSRCISILVMVALSSTSAFGQAGRQDPSPKAQKTAFVSCCDENWKNCKSNSVRGPTLIAPDGKHRAYAEVAAQITGGLHGDDKMPDCHNKTTVYVSIDGKSFKTAFEYAGEEGADGNGIQLIDWSKDSTTLVADLIVWKYYSEGWAHNVLIWSVNNARKQALNDLFSKKIGRPCAIDANVMGFLTDSTIGLHVNPTDEFEDAPCVGEGTWSIGRSSFELNSIPNDTALEHNGRFESTS